MAITNPLKDFGKDLKTRIGGAIEEGAANVADNTINTGQATLVNPVTAPTVKPNVVQGGFEGPTVQETALDIPGIGNVAGFVQTDPNGNITGLTTAGINQLQNMGFNTQDIAGKVKGRSVQELGDLLRGGVSQARGVTEQLGTGLQQLGAGFGQQTQQHIQAGSPDNFIDSILSDYKDFFGGLDLTALGQAAKEYLSSLLTGQTAATRALQAQEAEAMTAGITNLMNGISAAAANAGITGGELSRLYNRGIAEVGRMMGDFAIENLIRMENTQAEGFQGIMDMFNLSQEAQANWLNAYMNYNTYKASENRYAIELAQNDPVAFQIWNKMQAGEEITQEDLNYWDQHKYDYWSPDDMLEAYSYYNSLDITPRFYQPTDPNTGEPMKNLAGEPVWVVDPKSTLSINPETGEPILTIGTTDDTPGDPPPKDPTLSVDVGGVLESVTETENSPTGYLSATTGLPVSVVDDFATVLNFDQYSQLVQGNVDPALRDAYIRAGDESAIASLVDDPAITSLVDNINNAEFVPLISLATKTLTNYLTKLQQENNYPASFVGEMQKLLTEKISPDITLGESEGLF